MKPSAPTYLIQATSPTTIEVAYDLNRREVLQGSGVTFCDTFEQATEAVKSRLNNRASAIRRELAQIEAWLANADAKYVESARLSDVFAERFSDVQSAIVALSKSPGFAEVGPFKLTNQYANAPATLFVVSLPEYGPVVQRFSPELDALVLSAFEQLGFKIGSYWNGSYTQSSSMTVTVETLAIPATQ